MTSASDDGAVAGSRRLELAGPLVAPGETDGIHLVVRTVDAHGRAADTVQRRRVVLGGTP